MHYLVSDKLMDADNLSVQVTKTSIILATPPPKLCRHSTPFIKAIIGGAVTNAAMRIARTRGDAAIVTAATEVANTAHGL